MTILRDGGADLDALFEQPPTAGETPASRVTTGAVAALRLGKASASEVPGLVADARSLGGVVLEAGPGRLLVHFATADAVASACHAARRLRRAPGVSVATGVHTGGFELSIVGQAHRVIAAGPNVSCVIALADVARTGAIVLSPAAARAMGSGPAGRRRGDGVVLRDARPRNGGTVAAHRADEATVAVLAFSGSDDIVRAGGVAALTDRLDHLVRALEASADAYGISLQRVEAGVDGGRIILTAASPVADGMLHTLDVVRRPPPGLALRCGVDYSGTLADGLTRAAWLADESRSGEVLVSSRVASRLRAAFTMTPLPKVAGKRRRVAGYRMTLVAPVSR